MEACGLLSTEVLHFFQINVRTESSDLDLGRKSITSTSRVANPDANIPILDEICEAENTKCCMFCFSRCLQSWEAYRQQF